MRAWWSGMRSVVVSAAMMALVAVDACAQSAASSFSRPRANPWVAGSSETVRQTTPAFISSSQTTSMKVVAAVNGDLFDIASSPTTTLEGFNVSNGVLVSPGAAPGGTEHATFAITRSNAAGVVVTDDTTGVGDTWNAVTGIYQCLLNGAPRLSGTDPQPRTGLGVSSDTRYIYMMTVDGRSALLFPLVSPVAPLLAVGEGGWCSLLHFQDGGFLKDLADGFPQLRAWLAGPARDLPPLPASHAARLREICGANAFTAFPFEYRSCSFEDVAAQAGDYTSAYADPARHDSICGVLRLIPEAVRTMRGMSFPSEGISA